jgi:hypothetical protein
MSWPSSSATMRRWTLSASAKSILLGLAAAALLFQWGRIMYTSRGDFVRHWEFGRRFVSHEILYAGGLDVPYLPFWAMAHAPLSALPVGVAQSLAYPACVLTLIALLYLLNRLTKEQLPLRESVVFWLNASVLACASPFVLRDLDEAGANLPLLAMAWLSIFLWTRHRDVLGGLSLGCAIALKCTPGLLLLYFAWKRQWKFAAMALATAATLTVAPAAWQGAASYRQHLEIWFHHARRASTLGNPTQGVLGEEPVQNHALRPALARLLMRLPPGHSGRVDHPWCIDLFDLPATQATWIISAAFVALLGTIAWLLRIPVSARTDPSVPWECATVCLAMLLFSPITWGQHCVATIPAYYLIVRTAIARGRLSAWATVPLALVLLVTLGLNRTFVGREYSSVLASYHTTTWSVIILLTVTVVLWRESSREASTPHKGHAQPVADSRSRRLSFRIRPHDAPALSRTAGSALHTPQHSKSAIGPATFD